MASDCILDKLVLAGKKGCPLPGPQLLPDPSPQFSSSAQNGAGAMQLVFKEHRCSGSCSLTPSPAALPGPCACPPPRQRLCTGCSPSLDSSPRRGHLSGKKHHRPTVPSVCFLQTSSPAGTFFLFIASFPLEAPQGREVLSSSHHLLKYLLLSFHQPITTAFSKTSHC